MVPSTDSSSEKVVSQSISVVPSTTSSIHPRVQFLNASPSETASHNVTHSTGADKETNNTNTTTVIGMKNTSKMNNCSDVGQYVYEFLIPVSLLPFIMYVLIIRYRCKWKLHDNEKKTREKINGDDGCLS